MGKKQDLNEARFAAIDDWAGDVSNAFQRFAELNADQIKATEKIFHTLAAALIVEGHEEVVAIWGDLMQEDEFAVSD